MAISTYTELQTAIDTWSKRTDLAALSPDFIALAEKRIGRQFSPRSTEAETELTTVASSRYVALPAGMSNPTGLWLKAELPRVELVMALPSTIAVSDTAGYPEYWCIDGTNIAFDKPCTSAWAFDFRYKTPLALSIASPTNYVLTYYPDLYLFAAMIEASLYSEDTNAAALYEARYQGALREAQSAENSNKSGAVMFTEFGGNSGRGAIFRG